MRLCGARIRAWMVTGGLGLAVASWPSSAEAADFDLAWSAPAGCPSRLDILAATRARLPESAPTGAPPVFIQGTVTPERGGFGISLALKDGSGDPIGERHVNVEGENCRAVEGPTALLLAIMIAERPAAEDAPGPEQAPPAEPPPPSSPSAPAPPPSPPLSEPAAPPAVPVAPGPRSTRFSFGVAGVTSFGVLPGTGLGAALRATYAPGTLVLFGLEAGFDAGGAVHAGSGDVRFQLVSGAAFAGLRARENASAELILTVAARAGAVLVQPSNYAVVHSPVGTAALGGPGVLVRLRFARRLFVDVWPEIDAVFARDRFWIRDGETFEIHRSSLVAGRLSLGLAYELR